MWVGGIQTRMLHATQLPLTELCSQIVQETIPMKTCGMSFHNTVDCAQIELCIMWIAANVNCAFHGLFTKCVQETALVDI